jgi:hypothetical protein
MRERFPKNQMNGQFFEKMKWRQFLYIFSHGLKGKVFVVWFICTHMYSVSTERYDGNLTYITKMESLAASNQSTLKDS